MNILLWVLQILLALHTVTGAVWKFSNSEQTVPSLAAMPHALWLALALIEFVCAAGLVLPVLNKRFAKYAPMAALVITGEMLLFCAFHLTASNPGGAYDGQNPMAYWLVIAALSGLLAYGRRAKKRR